MFLFSKKRSVIKWTNLLIDRMKVKKVRKFKKLLILFSIKHVQNHRAVRYDMTFRRDQQIFSEASWGELLMRIGNKLTEITRKRKKKDK